MTYHANPEGALQLHIATPYTPFPVNYIAEIVSASVTFGEGI